MNLIHPTAIIDNGVELGSDNKIGPFCVIRRGVKIGNNNKFFGYCSVGASAEHRDFFDRIGEIQIGDNNIIREFTTINSSTKGVTRLGNSCVMLRGSHLSHDSVIEDEVTLSCNALVGGESHLMRGCNIALGAVLHQRTLIGSWAFVGMNSTISKTATVKPGETWYGSPAKFKNMNSVGLARANVTEEILKKEIERWKLLKEKI